MSGQSNVRKFGTVLSEASGQSRANADAPPRRIPIPQTQRSRRRDNKENVPPPQPVLSPPRQPLPRPFGRARDNGAAPARRIPPTPQPPAQEEAVVVPQPPPRTFRRVRFADQVRVPEALVVVETPLQEMSAPSISAMEVDDQPAPQSTLETIGGGISSRQRRQREAEDDGDSPTKRRRQGSENQDVIVTASNQASGLLSTESYMEDVVVEATNLVLVIDQPANEPLETVVPPPAFIENVDDHSGERPSSSRSRKPSLRQTTLKLRDRTVAGAKHTYRTAIQTRSKTRSSPYAR